MPSLSSLVVRFTALLTGAMGMVNLLSATLPGLHARMRLLRTVLPMEVRHGSRLAATLAGFALLILAQHLWRRKRVAWAVTMAVLVVSAVTNLGKGLDWEEASLSAVLLAVLWFQRRSFFARSDVPTVRRGITVAVTALLFTLAYGIVGFYLLDRHFKVNFGLTEAVEQTIAMFASFSDPGLEPTTGFGRWFADSLYLVGAGTGGYALLCLLWPVLHRTPATREERERAKQIIEQYGHSSVARFLLFEDKAYWFSPGGSVVGFAVAGRTCVALGDPVGPREDTQAAILGFRDFCAAHDWQPAFYHTLPESLNEYRAAGFSLLCVGHEAVVDLEGFTLAGGANKSLRGAVGRLQKGGHRAEAVPPPHSDLLLAELREVSDVWLGAQRGTGGEKRFSLGWFDTEYLQDGPILVVRGPEGAVSAFANIIPEYQICESTIDLTRRRPDAPNGTMDLLYVSLFEWAKARGFRAFNLGLCPLAGVGENADSPAIEKAMRYLYDHLNRFYNFRGLHEYKEKFHPQWQPRYLVYGGGPAGLPGAALAVVRADNAGQPLWRFWTR